MEQALGPGRHGVLEGSEALHALGFRPRPQRLRVRLRGGQRLRPKLARVVGEGGGDELQHFLLDRIERKNRLARRGRVALPRLPVLGIKAELPPQRPAAAVHQDAGIPSDLPVERIHPPGRRVALTGGELLGRRQPALVGHHANSAARDQGSYIHSEFPLGGLHHRQSAQLVRQRREGEPIRPLDHGVTDGDAALRLLEREVSQVGQYQRQFLLVVWSSGGFRRALDEDDARAIGIETRQRSDPVTQLVVRNEQPLPARRIRGPCRELPSKDAAAQGDPFARAASSSRISCTNRFAFWFDGSSAIDFS